VKSTRNRPLFAKLEAPKSKIYQTPDEIYARSMQEASDRVASFLGICTDCGEYMHRVDEVNLICLICPQQEPLDLTSEDLHTDRS